MTSRYESFVTALKTALLDTPGDTSREARAAAAAGGPLSDSLGFWARKVANDAHRATDEDTRSLTEAGYSDDAILEVTLNAAFGAGEHRLARGLALLKEDAS